MARKSIRTLRTLAMVALAASAVPAQAVLYGIGDYVFDGNAFITGVTGFTGTAMYDGTAWVDPRTNPGNVTDIDFSTYLSTGDYDGYRTAALNLKFGNWQVVNGPGADIALFFGGDQSGNSISVLYGENFATLTSFTAVSDTEACGGQCYVTVNGANVPLMVAELDIGPFYSRIDTISLFMEQATGSGAVVFTLGAAINAAPVPVPAAVWLFGSGLLGLVGVARRRR